MQIKRETLSVLLAYSKFLPYLATEGMHLSEQLCAVILPFFF